MIVLSTARLQLRHWRADDLDDWVAINADPEARRFLGDGKPVSRADSWHMMAAAVGNMVLRGYGMWAVEEKKASGRLIGRVGLYFPPHFPDIEVNWLIGRPWWGQGYATEAAQACCDYGFTHLKLETLSAFIHPDNTRSLGVARRLGMEDIGQPWPDHADRQYQIDRVRWQKRPR